MEPIIIKGSHFFYQNSGDQFFVRGIQYQDFSNDFNTSLSFVDPLEDQGRCARDIPFFKALRINTIFVLTLREVSHSACMKLLRDAGIYVIVNLGGRTTQEGLVLKWDYPLSRRFNSIVNELARFPNVLSFSLNGAGPKFLPFAKAAIRDLKDSLHASGNRAIPIGYHSALGNHTLLYQVLGCGGQDISVDFLFYTPDTPCTNASQLRDAMEQLVSIQTPLPFIVVSTSCDIEQDAESKILLSTYSENYTAVHSGVTIFSYFDNAYSNRRSRPGLVEVTGANVVPRPAFSIVSSQFAQMQPVSTRMSDYTPAVIPQLACASEFASTGVSNGQPPVTSTTILRLATSIPPKPDPILCSCMMDEVGCLQPDTSSVEEKANKTIYKETGIDPSESALYKTVCPNNETWCLGSTTDTAYGRYGAFSVCNATERKSWVLHRLYSAHKNDAEACTSAGGMVRIPRGGSQSRQCRFLLQQAGPDGTGSVLQTRVPDEPLRAPNPSKPGWSSSTIANASIGIAVLVLVCLAALILLFHHRRKRRKAAELELFEKAELPADAAPLAKKELFEMHGDERKEIEGTQVLEGDCGVTAEMPTIHNEPVELEVVENKGPIR